ncbi:molecular chaperone DnaJ [Clostridiaceae bacterium 14S0207]|nr:molecular chaperone DnaJ [Clostridiaceae bacterium 14S0207]
MRDPYEVLQVRQGASRDEIKSAYKKLAKQFHPDQYGDNPLKDLAEQKMMEINEAYEYLMKNTSDSYSQRQNSYNNQNNNYNTSNNQSYDNSTGDIYQRIRMDINSGNLSAAEQQLNNVAFKDAEWNYLMGLIYLRKGWYDSASTYITTAFNLNPSNIEYRNAYNNLSTQNNSYRKNYYGKSTRDNDMCDLCVKLWCADSLCECMGGDLISCF